jgi:undecaprenyl phosphate-alpha-L-ara4FN deformylase
VAIALKVDVDTLRGTLEGVPNLLRLFDRHKVRATFLFSLGPDHTGRAVRRVFRRGFLSKVRRTSVGSHYGIRTLLYGTLLPGPHIGRRGAETMRSVRAAGHEVGIHCYDHVEWQDQVALRDESWTRREMERAAAEFERVFGRPARVHGSAGWQINAHLLKLEGEMGFDYASDTRGQGPFLPVLQEVAGSCPQIPTTLPTLDELIGWGGWTEANVADRVHAASRRLPAGGQGHVYTLHAELEGMRLLGVMDRLLARWGSDGLPMQPLEEVFARLDLPGLPRHRVAWGSVEGRSGRLVVQGPEVEGG